MTCPKTVNERTPFPSLLIFCLIMLGMLSGCKSNPDVELCILYTDAAPEEQAVLCENMKTGKTRDITLIEAHKFISVSPVDYENLRSWYKSGCSD